MSASKRFLLDGGLQSEPFKSEWKAKLAELQARLTVRIPMRRKNPLPGRRWDPNWPNCLEQAARELGLETVRINDGIFVARDADARRMKDRAQALSEQFAERLRKARDEIDF